MADAQMPVKWIVLVEAAASGPSGGMEPDDVGRLLEALDPGGGALHSPDRYALQLTTTAASPGQALIGVLARWADAVRELGLPNWQVVRTEVLTPEELERDLESSADVMPLGRPLLETAERGEDDHGHELLRRAFSDPLTGPLAERRSSTGSRLRCGEPAASATPQ